MFRPNPVLLLILIIGGMEFWRRWKERGSDPGSRAYYQVTRTQRTVVGVTYIGLAVLLGLAMNATHLERGF